MKIFQKRAAGSTIPCGVSWQWVGGPIVRFVPESRAWRFNLRVRGYNHYPPDAWYFNPGFCMGIYDHGGNGESVIRWEIEWNRTTGRPKLHKNVTQQ